MKFKPVSNNERLMFTTVQIKTTAGSGTGFFFEFNIDGKYIPVIVTNRHVVNDNPNERIAVRLNFANDELEKNEHIASVKIEHRWYFHPTEDLCCTVAHDLFGLELSDGTGKMLGVCLDESTIPSAEELLELDAIEDVTMVGYPIGISDSQNNLPVFRNGKTATHPAIDFNGKPWGVVDMACLWGSSGSPILTAFKAMYLPKSGGRVLMMEHGFPQKLLGIQFSIPNYSVSGEVSIINTPTTQKEMASIVIPTNLGYYIKSSEILVLKDIIKKALESGELTPQRL